jgi:protein-S-isoprenylcysteine O-methyltransferase Ste14
VVRHPLYAGTFIFIWGLFILVPSLSLLISNTIITIYTLIGLRFEEQKLEKEFGDAYKTYKQKVPMIIPKFSR